jgi:hypothetical protein
VVRLFRGSRVQTRGVFIAGGRECARRLQRVRLSQLCQGAEDPEEVIGIFAREAVEEIYICHDQ